MSVWVRCVVGGRQGWAGSKVISYREKAWFSVTVDELKEIQKDWHGGTEEKWQEMSLESGCGESSETILRLCDILGTIGTRVWHDPVYIFFLDRTVWRAGSSSLTRDRTRAPCVGSVESDPLDHQGGPQPTFLKSLWKQRWEWMERQTQEWMQGKLSGR